LRNDLAIWKQTASLSITQGPAIKVSRFDPFNRFQMAALLSTSLLPWL
jgi:hypothetical protein